jgi:hypothetical protein
MHDFFISHASEDKETIALPLASALREQGFEVWYDDFTLRIGDSLRESIERGLATSRFGVVILSPRFFAKHWPKQELNALFALESSDGQKRILPVVHDLTFVKLAEYSPLLADRRGVSTEIGVDAVVKKLIEALSSTTPVPRPTPPAPLQSKTLNMPPGYERRLQQIRFDIAARQDPKTGKPLPPEDVVWDQTKEAEKRQGHAVLVPEYLKACKFDIGFIPPRLRLWNFGGGPASDVSASLDGLPLNEEHPLHGKSPVETYVDPDSCLQYSLKPPSNSSQEVELVLGWGNADGTRGTTTANIIHVARSR